MTGDKYDTLFLIAQAVKSGLPLAEAIRLTIGNGAGLNDRKFLHLADLLDKGAVPIEAVRQSALPVALRNLFETALVSNDFSATFDELTEKEIGRILSFQKVVQALAYPCLLLFFTILAAWFLMVFTVPQFEAIYTDFGTELPDMTNALLETSHLFLSPLGNVMVVVMLAVLIFGIPVLFPRVWFCVPILGHVFRCISSSRFLRQLGSLVQRQVPLPDALEQCGGMMRNRAYRKDCRRAATDARKGMDLTEIVCRYYWLFPAWLAPMVEADGSPESLTKSFKRTAETVEQQRDYSISLIQILSLPFFIMVIFSVVMFLVVALFMPLVKLISDLSM